MAALLLKSEGIRAMKYRLNSPHYHYDMILEAGTEVGDGTPFPWRYANGDPEPPSMEMEPLDQEAVKMYKDRFPHGRPDLDPAIMIKPPAVTSPPKVAPKEPPPPTPNLAQNKPKLDLPAAPAAKPSGPTPTSSPAKFPEAKTDPKASDANKAPNAEKPPTDDDKK
jgi:hypothetical protein